MACPNDLQEGEFFYSVDNTAFTVKPSEKIASKKVTNIGITYKVDPKVDPTKPVLRTGKLTVMCPSQTPSAWVYYLQASEGDGKGK